MLSITTLARLSGVKQETIRTWERRYGVIQPDRDDRGRRIYSDQDAQRLRVDRSVAKHRDRRGGCADADVDGRTLAQGPAEH